jgi:hypothetical protein
MGCAGLKHVVDAALTMYEMYVRRPIAHCRTTSDAYCCTNGHECGSGLEPRNPPGIGGGEEEMLGHCPLDGQRERGRQTSRPSAKAPARGRCIRNQEQGGSWRTRTEGHIEHGNGRCEVVTMAGESGRRVVRVAARSGRS